MGDEPDGGGNLVRVSAIKLADGLSSALNPVPDGCSCGCGAGGGGGVPKGEGVRAAGLGLGLGVRVRCRGETLEFCDI